MSICCCKECTDRHIGCHSTCDKYIEWSKENERIRDKIRIEKQQSNVRSTKQSARRIEH